MYVQDTASMTVQTVEMAGHNAYKVAVTSQAKLYVKPELVANKSNITFTIYIPSTSTGKFDGNGEFMIRVKPNESEPLIDGGLDGHIVFRTKKDKPNVSPDLEIVFDEWRTYTIDISNLGTSCTEWAFYVATGNVVYIRDVVIA